MRRDDAALERIHFGGNMDSAQLAAQLEQVERERTSIVLELEIQIAAFRRVLPGLAVTWIEQETKRQIDANSERIATIELAALSEMKSEIQSLIGRLPQLCDQAIARGSTRPPDSPTMERHQSSRIHEDLFESLFRAVVNPLGEILAKYGLLPGKGASGASWERTGATGYRYRHNTGMSPDEVEPIANYGKLLEQLRALDRQLPYKRIALAQAKAREKWESA
jgi:hypothetical protein